MIWPAVGTEAHPSFSFDPEGFHCSLLDELMVLKSLLLKLFGHEKLPCSREVCCPLLTGFCQKALSRIFVESRVCLFFLAVYAWIAAVFGAELGLQLVQEIWSMLLFLLHMILLQYLQRPDWDWKLNRTNKANLCGVLFWKTDSVEVEDSLIFTRSDLKVKNKYFDWFKGEICKIIIISI